MFKKSNRSAWVYAILVVMVTIPLCWRIFGSNIIDAHDSVAGLIRALCMNKYMGHGQFLVRWAPEINFGHGYPMFNFYPPFFYLVSVLFFQLTHDMVLAINLACSVFWILSGVGMFLLAREFWGNEGGMISAVLYVYAPYHIADLYVRGAFAEFSSFAFFPFLLFSILQVSRKVSFGNVFLGVISAFGLSLTHNIMSMLFFPVAMIFMFYLYFIEKKPATVLIGMGMLVIGLMMSSFFWLPALLEKKFLNLDFLTSMIYDFHKNFISLQQLFWPFDSPNYDHITLQVGIVHTLLCLCAILILPKIFKINRFSGFMSIFGIGLGLAAVFCALSASTFLWEKIGMLSFIQFPWRFLTIIVFATSLLGGSIALIIKDPKLKKICLLFIGFLVMFVYPQISHQPRFVDTETTIDRFLAMGEGEYTPRWVHIPPEKTPEKKFELVQGKGLLDEEKSLNFINYETKFQAIEPSLLCFHTFYFPGWRVYIDGQMTNPNVDNPFGLIAFFVPPGSHDIQVIFGPTPVRIAGMVFSWIGTLLLIILFIFLKKNKKFNNSSIPNSP